MILSSLLFHAIAGYWFLVSYKNTAYRIKDETSYHVLLQAAIAGSLLFLLSHSILWGVGQVTADGLSATREWMPKPITPEVVVSLILARAIPVVLHLFRMAKSDDTIVSELAEDAGGHIELLAIEALERDMPIEVTLRNRKVYVGYVWVVTAGKGRDGDLSLFANPERVPGYGHTRLGAVLGIHTGGSSVH